LDAQQATLEEIFVAVCDHRATRPDPYRANAENNISNTPA